MTRRLSILAVHNAYQQPGGEDAVFRAETELMRAAGHEVEPLLVENSDIQSFSDRLAAAVSATYNAGARRQVAARLAARSFDLVHVHNFFPQLSPSVFDATTDAGVPSVWTLHNFRVACANGVLFRDGALCEECLGRWPMPAIVHRCYRGSLAGSASVAAMIGAHAVRGTWRRKVGHFIVLSDFARGKFVQAGLPDARLRIKPNFVVDPGVCHHEARSGFVFAGRLSPEKGCDILLAAWRDLPFPLTVIGDGPELDQLRAAAPPNVTFLGRRPSADVRRAMASAIAVIVPSLWYEAFGLVAVEAMALGTPVIASRLGALPEIVSANTGLLVPPGDPAALRAAVIALATDPNDARRRGAEARRRYEQAYSPERNQAMLEAIYRDAIADQETRRG